MAAALRGPVGAVAVAMVVGAALLLATGHNPVDVASEFMDRVVKRPAGIEESLIAMTPILVAALAAWVAARLGLWNIGIDGQVAAGALVAGGLAPALDSIPAPAMWAIVTLAAMLAGAGWALIPAVLRARSGINEIVTTIMMTYVAFSLASWLIKGPLKDEAHVAPATAAIDIARRLPKIDDTRIHIGVVIVVALAIFAWLLARWTVVGMLSRLVGEAPAAAGRLNVPVGRYLLVGFLLSGAVASLAGVTEVLAIRGAVQGDWRPSLTLPAFAALFLARRHSLGLIPASFLLGMLAYASTVLPRSTNVAPAFFPMLEGVLLIALALGEWRQRDVHPVAAESEDLP
jgi:simple sugar transport system permease protein